VERRKTMAVRDIVPWSLGKKGLQVRHAESPFAVLHKEMDELFDSFRREFFELEPFESRLTSFSPRIDVSESEKEIMVTAELPGMDEKDVELSINREALTIKGEKREEKEEKGKTYYRMERAFGGFTRTIPLPAEADIDKVEASYKKGVLRILVPKTEKALKETKKISVKAE